jgi:hypothetical protein
MKLLQASTNLIPVMGFERELIAATGLTLDQSRFALAFIGAVLSGALMRGIRSPTGALMRGWCVLRVCAWRVSVCVCTVCLCECRRTGARARLSMLRARP